MKWIRYSIVPALFAGLLTVLCAEDVSPWDLWRQGYTSFEKGESARDCGDHVRALALPCASCWISSPARS